MRRRERGSANERKQDRAVAECGWHRDLPEVPTSRLSSEPSRCVNAAQRVGARARHGQEMPNRSQAWSTDAEGPAEIAQAAATLSAVRNSTPICVSLCQARRQGRIDLSTSNMTSKRSGMPSVVSTFRHAPVDDRLRTTQLMTD